MNKIVITEEVTLDLGSCDYYVGADKVDYNYLRGKEIVNTYIDTDNNLLFLELMKVEVRDSEEELDLDKDIPLTESFTAYQIHKWCVHNARMGSEFVVKAITIMRGYWNPNTMPMNLKRDLIAINCPHPDNYYYVHLAQDDKHWVLIRDKVKSPKEGIV